MEKDLIDFSQLSAYWPLCYNAECSRKEECIRYQVCQQMLDDKQTYLCLLPNVLRQGECNYFKPIRMVRVAKGFKKLLGEVREKDRTALQHKIAAYLGTGGTYYRYRKGTKCLYPEQIEWITNLFNSYGYTDEVVFDEYCDIYRVDD